MQYTLEKGLAVLVTKAWEVNWKVLLVCNILLKALSPVCMKGTILKWQCFMCSIVTTLMVVPFVSTMQLLNIRKCDGKRFG